jgi:enoyl-CoA hydratase/carnithine racemase
MTTASALTKPAQIRVARRSPAYWRVTIDNPPINVMGPEMVRQFQEVMDALEADEHVRVVVQPVAAEGFCPVRRVAVRCARFFRNTPLA